MIRSFIIFLIAMLLPFTLHAGITVSHGITLMDELKYPANFKHLDYVNPNAPKGGRVRMAAIGSFDSLNPFMLRGISAELLPLLFDTLLSSVEDEASSEYGLLAESIRRPDDNMWVEFTLRRGAKFRDGTAVTAEDVVWTFNMLREQGHPAYRAYYRVKSAQALNNRTIRFDFHHGENRELALILGQFPITSKAFYEEHDVTRPGLTVPMGSGPYSITRAVAGKSITFERRDDYWAKNLPINVGRYNFDNIRLDYYRDETIAIEALKAGEYDFRQENVARLWATAYDVPAVRDGRLKQELIPHQIPSGMQGMFFNTRRPQFADRRVRKAITLAFDYEWANKNLFYNSYKRSLSYFANSPLGASGLPDEDELALLTLFKDILPPDLFDTPFSLPINPTPYDIRPHLIEAGKLLEDAGYVMQDGRRVHAETGKVLTVEFLATMPSFVRVMAPFRINLARLGIAATIRLVDSAQYQKRIEQFDYDMVTLVYPQSMSPGNEQHDYWHSDKADIKGSRNISGIRNQAVDHMVDAIARAKNRDSLLTATRALDRILLHEYYCVPGWHFPGFRIIYWDRFGKPETRPLYGLGFPHTWWDNSL